MACIDDRDQILPGQSAPATLQPCLVSFAAPLLTYEGTVEVELASGMVIEAAVYSGMICFDGQELTAKLRKTCGQN